MKCEQNIKGERNLKISYNSTVDVAALSMVSGESGEITSSNCEIYKVGVVRKQSTGIQ